MSKVVFLNSYKLKKKMDVSEFLYAVDQLHNEYIAKQKGYISFELMVDGETWADATTFETMEDAKRFAGACEPNEYAERFYAFLNLTGCRSNFFTIEKSY